jgi:hypothetical protein
MVNGQWQGLGATPGGRRYSGRKIFHPLPDPKVLKVPKDPKDPTRRGLQLDVIKLRAQYRLVIARAKPEAIQMLFVDGLLRFARNDGERFFP